MKKLFILIVAIAMIGLVACGTSVKKEQSKVDSTIVKVDTTKKDTVKAVKVDTTKKAKDVKNTKGAKM